MSITIESREAIRARMLSDVPAQYDKTAGSFHWDMLDPVAAEIVRAEETGEAALDSAFVETAEGADLNQVVWDRAALTRKAATYAVGEVTITGAAGTTVPLGLIVTSDTVGFRITEAGTVGEDGTVTLPIMCTTAGTAGNVAAQSIRRFGISYTGLYSVENEEPTESGYDEEPDEALRERCLEAIRDPGSSGNATHYREWAASVAGVGGARVTEIWNGPGTVRVVLIGMDGKSVGDAVVSDAAAYIETQRPIGAEVTVISAAEKAVNITATVTLRTGGTIEAAKADFAAQLEEYLSSTAFRQNTVSHARVGALLLGADGVEDYKNLTLNGAQANLDLSDNEVGVVGTVTISAG